MTAINLAPDAAVAFRARWLVPIDRPPIDGGVVTIVGERITVVGRNDSGRPPIDLGDVALLPGLVNAHTHLEFSELTEPLGAPGMAFPQWIEKVVHWRHSLPLGRVLGSTELEVYHRKAVARGLAELQQSGAVAVGDIVTSASGGEALGGAQAIDCTAFVEAIALRIKHAVPTFVRTRLAIDELPAGVRPGISPHAPYTVHPMLLTESCRLSAQRQLPLAMHLAESREELELLRFHRGPLVETLTSLSAWDETSLPLGLRPLDYLQALATAHRALVIHGNYLDADEVDYLAARRDTMTLVYCARTHAYFGHEPYPLAQLLAKGVCVAVGTDSRASNPDLRVLEELRYISRQHPTVPPEKVVALGTLAGAQALGIAQDYGSIAPGKSARLAVVPVAPRVASPLEELLNTGAECRPLADAVGNSTH